jgi:hypothetical protein
MRKGFPLVVTLVIASFMACAVPICTDAACVNPPANLVSWWGGDNNALDIVGTNHGTLNGAAYAPGKVSQAFSFDGTEGYVNVPYSSSLDLQGSLTITAWINSTNNSSLNRGIAGKAGGYQIYVEAGGLLVFGFYNVSGGWTLLHSSILIPENAWVHVAGTFNSTDGTMQLYINGAPDTSLSTAQRLSANANPVKVGGFGSDGSPFSGRIDEVGIFNPALSASEIATIYNADSSGMCRPSVVPPSGLVSWWQGENDATDYIGVNNGTLKNGASFAQGKVGQAFSFNGTNQYVEVPNSTLWNFGSNDFSINFWVNFDGADSFFLGHDNGGYVQNKWIFYLSGGKLSFHINGPYSVEIGQFPYTFAPGQWYLLAVTRSGSTYTIYVNGAPLGTATDNRAIPDATAPLTIGQSEGIKFVNGLMDEIGIFSRALAADEIASIYNAGSAGMIFTPDTTPNTFNFISQTGMPLNAAIVSNPITVTGINTSTAISIAVGEYSVSTDEGGTWGSWNSETGTVSVYNQVKVRQMSSASNSIQTTATLTIGGVSGDFAVTTAASGDPNASGLVSWWKATNTYDSVGGNHGTLQGGAGFAGGTSWQAFSFDGVDDYFRVLGPQNIPVGNSQRTISAWIMSSGSTAGTKYQTVLGYGTPGNDGQTFLLEWGGDVNDRKLYLTGWNRDIAGSTSLNYNQWYHVAVTYDGTTVRLYINDVLDANADRSLNTIINAHGLMIGNSPANDGWHANFNGFIYGVKIFNRALSSTEVSKLAGTLPDPFTFAAVTGAQRSSSVESNTITVIGTSHLSAISISGGEYKINGSGTWTASPGTFNPGDTVKVRLITSGSYSATTIATLTIGGVSGTFSVTTLADTDKPVVTTFTLHTTVSSAMSVSVDSFIATDNDRVSGYLVTDTATPPVADDAGWSATTPATVTLATAGDNILRAWTKDPAGNVSNPLTATVLLKPVRRDPENDYVSLQTAYGEAGSGETIRVLAVTLPENIGLNQPRDISISGGYEDGFAGQNGYSTISGSLTVGKGTLTVERIILK